MPDCSPHLLLVGQHLGSVTVWMRTLEAQGCLWEFVESPEAARRSMERTDFEVVLVDSRLPHGGAYDLIGALQGSRTSLFFWVPLRHSGCWLPIVLRGRHMPVSEPIRSNLFSRALASLLHVSGFGIPQRSQTAPRSSSSPSRSPRFRGSYRQTRRIVIR